MRKQLSLEIPSEALVCDMTTGVGAFAMYLASKGCVVLANDLNPEAVRYVGINSALNKVEDNVFLFNMDARHFGTLCIDRLGLETIEMAKKRKTPVVHIPPNGPNTDSASCRPREGSVSPLKFPSTVNTFTEVHFILNLPELSIDLLDCFKELRAADKDAGAEIQEKTKTNVSPRDVVQIMIHCFCFARTENKTIDSEAALKVRQIPFVGSLFNRYCRSEWKNRWVGGLAKPRFNRCPGLASGSLTSAPSSRFIQIRNVAPNKTMFCVRSAFFGWRSSEQL
eukprot:GHVN01006728.1.p1 GENE.GHVN01006728.1~~GHVN01006728.1.p1  ORF type:complete len:281 (-),score=29.56 GHVN01006728.1:538-1380(-)